MNKRDLLLHGIACERVTWDGTMTTEDIDYAELCRLPQPEPARKPWLVEAYGHPTKPDIAGRFEQVPDLEGYRYRFTMLMDN